MTQSITILGATGSIGRSTLDVVSRYPERFSVHAVAGGSRVKTAGGAAGGRLPLCTSEARRHCGCLEGGGA